MTGRGPQRRANDHVHPEYWTEEDHYRFEKRVTDHLEKLETAVDGLTNRITLMLGALALIAFLIPVIAPFIRGWLDIPAPPVQWIPPWL